MNQKGRSYKVIGFGKYKGPTYSEVSKPAYRKAAITGIVAKVEAGGDITDTQCVYVGHGVADFQLNNVISQSLIKFMFNAVGIPVVNVYQAVPWDGKVVITRLDKTGDNKALVKLTQAFTTAMSYRTLAFNLFGSDSDQKIFGNAHTDIPVHWQNIELYKTDEATADVDKIVGCWKMKGLMVHMFAKSTIAVQNITQSGSTGALTDDASSIWANPIKGIAYVGQAWKNGFQYDCRFPSYTLPATSPVNNVFRADRTYGTFKTNYTALKLVSPYDNKFIKPPQGYEFMEKVKTARVHLDPGDVKKQSSDFTASMVFGTYHEKMRNILDTTQNSTEYAPFGFPCMFAFEKSVDMRKNAADLIRVGYEVNQTYTATWTYKWDRKTEPEYILEPVPA